MVLDVPILKHFRVFDLLSVNSFTVDPFSEGFHQSAEANTKVQAVSLCKNGCKMSKFIHSLQQPSILTELMAEKDLISAWTKWGF